MVKMTTDNQLVPLVVLSDQVDYLDTRHKDQYGEKLQMSGLQHDPYLMPASLFEPCLAEAQELPDLEYAHIYCYLIDSSSAYTKEMTKAYKSLEAYKYFVSGFVAALGQY